MAVSIDHFILRVHSFTKERDDSIKLHSYDIGEAVQEAYFPTHYVEIL